MVARSGVGLGDLVGPQRRGERDEDEEEEERRRRRATTLLRRSRRQASAHGLVPDGGVSRAVELELGGDAAAERAAVVDGVVGGHA